ncbi:SCO7613 C-terminal domain-containing membrane protein, partial [Nocardioides sp.]|uniref:SCO7613 C-terminal domain-containing membrane protein n=1 Tax=Nocardioides sp. TaxID=35761 RepID=UPI0039E3932A
AALPGGVRVAAGVVAAWLLGLAATAWALGSVAAGSLVLALAAGLAAIGAVLSRSVVGTGIARWVALTTAGLATGIGTLWLLGLAARVAEALADARSGTGGWDARYLVGDLRPDLAPAVVPLAVVAILATLAAWQVLDRVRRVLPTPSIVAVAIGALAPLLLGYTDRLLLVVVALGVIALLEVAAAWRLPGHWLLAVGAAAATGVVASYDPATATVVAAVAATVAVLLLRRGRSGEALVAALLTATLVATAAGSLASWLGLSSRWGGVLTVAATLVSGLTAPAWARRAVDDARTRWTCYAATIVAALTGLAAWARTADEAGALITLVAAAACLVALRERAPVVALGVTVVYAVSWLGLGSPVGQPPETYAVAAGLMVLLYGDWQLRRDRLAFLTAYGPGVAVGLVPSTAVALYDGASARGLVVAVLWTVVVVLVLRLGSGVPALVAALAGAVPPTVTLAIGADLAGLDRPWVGTVSLAGMLTFTVSGVVLGWARAILGRERWLGYGGALVVGGLLVGWGATTESWLAVDLTVLAAATAVVAIHERDRWIAALGSALGLVALWVRLHETDVDVPEAYTLPLAAVVLAFGAWTMWRAPGRRSLPTIGPGLMLGLVPSFVLTLRDPYTVRGLLVGLACLALVVLGAWRRWQAPFVLGAVLGVTMVVLGIGPYLRHVPPTWLVILAGAVLLAAGINWERLARTGRRSWSHVAELR